MQLPPDVGLVGQPVMIAEHGELTKGRGEAAQDLQQPIDLRSPAGHEVTAQQQHIRRLPMQFLHELFEQGRMCGGSGMEVRREGDAQGRAGLSGGATGSS
ncbi:MAG: hypothetical protein U1F35_17080 [Steroidobacteraceae bacterium]